MGNEACAPCHREIVERYSRTAMARTSGPAESNLIEGSFVHARSGVAYVIRQDSDGPVLQYSRPGVPTMSGRERLKYFVGSNSRGRTFLFDIDGFLYQSPVNYFARTGVWDMSPGYEQLTEMELNHPVDSSCLFCHASRARRPVAGTFNRFDGEPFLQPGVGCERCHGPGGAHVAAHGPIVNPAKLDAERRDGICMQCHLEGKSRIAKPGRTLLDYTPGDRLADYVSTFVFAGAAEHGLGAVSQVESFAVSHCKRASGDAMSCTSCHDPHEAVAPSERGEYFRAKCLACHSTLAAGHHPENRACTSCHMPRLASADVAHTAVTDHRILRRPGGATRPTAPTGTVVEFGVAHPDARELGLACAEVGARGGVATEQKAASLLESAVRERPDDPEVLTRLGLIDQERGAIGSAEQRYRHALGEDPFSAVAASNLGVILAGRGDLAGAVALWAPTYERNPQLSDVGLNLAAAQCGEGRVADARATLARLLRHDPDRGRARAMEQALDSPAPHCVGP